MRVLDLCAGIGGLRLACDAAGFENVGSVEWNPDKRALYAEHFGASSFRDVDVGSPHDWPEADLWTMSAAPALLRVALSRSSLPKMLWLQTADQDVDDIAIPGAFRAEFRTKGRVHVILSSRQLKDCEFPSDSDPVHRPGATRLSNGRLVFPNPEDAEEAQGFARGWTAGYLDETRREWLSQSVHVPTCTCVAAELARVDVMAPLPAYQGARDATLPSVETVIQAVKALKPEQVVSVNLTEEGKLKLVYGGPAARHIIRSAVYPLPMLVSQVKRFVLGV